VGFPGYYDYDVSDDGRLRHFGNRRGDYSTDLLTRQAKSFLAQSSDSSDPFFLWLAYEAPHGWPSPIHPCDRASSPGPPMPAAYRSGPRVDERGVVVSNQDIAATILDYANRYAGGVDTCVAPGHCRRMDGRTLAPLMGSGGTWPAHRGVLDEIAKPPHEYN